MFLPDIRLILALDSQHNRVCWIGMKCAPYPLTNTSSLPLNTFRFITRLAYTLRLHYSQLLPHIISKLASEHTKKKS